MTRVHVIRQLCSHAVQNRVWRLRLVRRVLRRAALSGLILHTNNFRNVKWLGRPIWQNPIDAWLLQQSLVEDEVDFVIECGTNRGGSAYYMASVFDLLRRGHIVTIDTERLHEIEHSRIDFLIGSSTDEAVVEQVRRIVKHHSPKRIFVMLDSDHSAAHVGNELRTYGEFVTKGCYLLVQDGCIDELPMFANGRPGPLAALQEFIASDDRFEIDDERSDRFLLSHSPSGWLRRVR